MTRNETPELARAMVACIRGKAKIDKGVEREVPFIRLFGDAIDIAVRYDDWVKVTPYLQESSFDPTIVPVAHPVVLHPRQFYDSALVSQNDRELYDRILTVLDSLFHVEFPLGQP